MVAITARHIHKLRGLVNQSSPRVPTLMLLVMILILSKPLTAGAHLMVAQHGTLNLVGDGAFMVLSLPVSAFDKLDGDLDGSVSMIEFNRRRASIIDSIDQHVRLSNDGDKLPLEGIMLSPVPEHESTDGSFSQLTVMGRFSLNGTPGDLRFEVQLFGDEPGEQTLKITATRKSDGQEQVLNLTPAASADLLFADTSR